MSRVATAALLAGAVLAACAREAPPPAGGISLPEGDADRGRETYRELHCYTCHAVEGEEFPPQGASPPTGVVLGETWDRRLSDDELVTAIINPSHEIAPEYEKARVTSLGDTSRMGNYADIMTVRQLVDLVAFLREVNERALQ